jgi:CysZ protein
VNGEFIEGFRLAVLGRQFLKSHRSLWRWILWPLALNIVLLLCGAYFGYSFISQKVGALFSNVVDSNSWFAWLQTPLMILVGLVFVLLWTFVFQSFAALILSPFYSFLIERVLFLKGIKTVEPMGFGAKIAFFARVLRGSILKSVLFLIIGLVLFLMSFIPGLNIVTLYLGMCLLAADHFDLIFETRGLEFSERMSGLWSKKINVFGLGLFYFICSFIPGLNLILTSFVVIGATLLESKEG